MFTEELSSFIGARSTPSVFKSSEKKNSSPMDFQYEICNIFLKHTGERLHSIEADLICQTNNFLTKLNKNFTKPEKNITLETASDSGILNP